MNSTQKLLIFLTIIVIVIMVYYPPWAVELGSPQMKKSLGYAPLNNPPKDQYHIYHVDTEQLMLQIGVAVLVGVGLVVITKK